MPIPKRSMFTGSNMTVIGSELAPMKSAKAPELNNGKTTKRRIGIIKVIFLFMVYAPGM
jgi:hypothetical protein